MGVEILLIVLLVGALAGFALLWRAISMLTREVRMLRGELERMGAVMPPVSKQDETPANASPEAAIAAAAVRSPLWDAPRVIKSDATSNRAFPAWLHWTWAVLGLVAITPFAALGLHGLGVSLALGATVVCALLFLALHERAAGLAWSSCGFAALWAGAVLAANAAATHPIGLSASLFVVSVAATAHAALDTDWRPGAALSAAGLALLIALTFGHGVVSAMGVAGGALAALLAATGAWRARLDALHLSGFIGAGVLIFVLSNQDQAGVWFTPAMAWAGAAFLGLAGARTPVLQRDAALISATGAIAPLFAIGGLYAAGHALTETWAAACGFAALAALLVLILVQAARNAGSISALALSGWVLMAGAFAAFAAMLWLALPFAYSGWAYAALATALAAIHRRIPDNLFLFFASLSATGALAAGVSALTAFNATIGAYGLAGLALAGMLGPALILAAAAWRLARAAHVTRAVVELGAGGCGLLFLSALARTVMTQASPATAPVGLAELGAHTMIWTAVALALLRYGKGGARETRVIAAGALMCAAGAASLVALALWLAGGWGPSPGGSHLAGWGKHAPTGLALMAAGAWLHWNYWRRGDYPLRAFAAFATACMLSAAWASLEFVWRRAAPGAPMDDATAGVMVASFAMAFILMLWHFVRLTRPQLGLDFQKNFKRHG